MANEITYTGSGANLRAAEVFNRLIWETLRDRTSLRSTLVKLGDLGGSGSDTLVTPTVAFDDAMGAANVNETAAVDNTTLGNGAISLSVAQQIISYELSDKMMITGSAGNLSLELLATKLADAYEMRLTDQVAALFASISSIVGTTGVDFDVDDWYDAMFTLEQAVVPGPWSAVLYTVQYTDLQSSLRGEGGAVQFMPATADQLQMKGPGYKGNLLGVDVWASDSVTTGGPDSHGAMYGLGAFALAEASPRQAMPGAISASVPAGSPVYAEFVRTGDPGLSAIVGHAFNAVGLAEDARAVEIRTDR